MKIVLQRRHTWVNAIRSRSVLYLSKWSGMCERTSGGIRLMDANEFFTDRTSLSTSIASHSSVHLKTVCKLRSTCTGGFLLASPHSGPRSSQSCRVMFQRSGMSWLLLRTHLSPNVASSSFLLAAHTSWDTEKLRSGYVSPLPMGADMVMLEGLQSRCGRSAAGRTRISFPTAHEMSLKRDEELQRRRRN